MPDVIEVFDCNLDDWQHRDALVRLMNEYITDKMGGGEAYTEAQKVALVEGLRNHPSRLIIMAACNGEVTGLVNCFVNFATFTVRPYVNIHDVVVTHAWRNKGVGRKMLERVIETAAGMGCSKVTLEVRNDNHNAKHLYHSLGFRDAEPRQYYWSKYL